MLFLRTSLAGLLFNGMNGYTASQGWMQTWWGREKRLINFLMKKKGTRDQGDVMKSCSRGGVRSECLGVHCHQLKHHGGVVCCVILASSLSYFSSAVIKTITKINLEKKQFVLYYTSW